MESPALCAKSLRSDFGVTDLDEDLCLCILCVDDLSINVHISVSLVAASWAEVVYRTRVVLTGHRCDLVIWCSEVSRIFISLLSGEGRILRGLYEHGRPLPQMLVNYRLSHHRDKTTIFDHSGTTKEELASSIRV